MCVLRSLWDAAGNSKGGSITVPFTSCLTGLESAVWQLNYLGFDLQNRLIQTSQIGGQWYNDTSPFSIPWMQPKNEIRADADMSAPQHMV